MRNARSTRPARAESWRLSLCFLNWQDAIISKPHCPAGRTCLTAAASHGSRGAGHSDKDQGRSPKHVVCHVEHKKQCPAEFTDSCGVDNAAASVPSQVGFPGHLTARTAAHKREALAVAPTPTLQVNARGAKLRAPKAPRTPDALGHGPKRAGEWKTGCF